MVYVTHDQTEAMTLGHTIVVMDRGSIQQIGRPEQIYHEPANPFVAAFIGTPPMNLFEGSFRLDQTGSRIPRGRFDAQISVSGSRPDRRRHWNGDLGGPSLKT